MTTTIVQGKEYPVGLRVKDNWEKHTTPEQRNDPNFNTSFSDSIKNSYEPLEKSEPVEEQVEIPEQPKAPAPEDRPQGPNYRHEAGKAILETKIKAQSEILERLEKHPKFNEPEIQDLHKTLSEQVQGYRDKIANIEKLDFKELPHIPMGESTHTKETLGYVHGETEIKVQTKVMSEPAYAMVNKEIQTMWNNLPDSTRDKVKTLKIQRSLGVKSSRGGSFDEWTGTMIMNINKGTADRIQHHFYHEVGHVEYDHIKRENPEKTEKWVKAMNEITIAPTKYADTFRDKYQRTMKVNNEFRRQRERLNIPITDFENERLTRNEYVAKDLYENEIHSEINAFAMGHLPDDEMQYGREVTNRYIEAYKELHDLK